MLRVFPPTEQAECLELGVETQGSSHGIQIILVGLLRLLLQWCEETLHVLDLESNITGQTLLAPRNGLPRLLIQTPNAGSASDDYLLIGLGVYQDLAELASISLTSLQNLVLDFHRQLVASTDSHVTGDLRLNVSHFLAPSFILCPYRTNLLPYRPLTHVKVGSGNKPVCPYFLYWHRIYYRQLFPVELGSSKVLDIACFNRLLKITAISAGERRRSIPSHTNFCDERQQPGNILIALST